MLYVLWLALSVPPQVQVPMWVVLRLWLVRAAMAGPLPLAMAVPLARLPLELERVEVAAQAVLVVRLQAAARAALVQQAELALTGHSVLCPPIYSAARLSCKVELEAVAAVAAEQVVSVPQVEVAGLVVQPVELFSLLPTIL